MVFYEDTLVLGKYLRSMTFSLSGNSQVTWNWVSSVQSLSCVWLFVTPWTAACQASLSSTNPWTCSNSCSSSWWCYATISSSVSPSPPAFNLSQHQVLFQWISSLHQVAKVLELQLWHQSFQCISGLISFRIAWLDFLAVQGTLKSLLQHTDQKHQFFAQPSLWSSFHIHK